MSESTTEKPCCAVCGGPLRSNNSVGICTKTRECEAAREERRRRARGEGPQKRGRSTCSVEGCSEPVQARGMCHTHDRRNRLYGDPGPAQRRHWGRVKIDAGEIYGRWTVLAECTSSDDRVSCRCECGKEKQIRAGNLVNGTSQSCGCARRHPRAPGPVPYMAAGYVKGRLTALEDAWKGADRIQFVCQCGTESARPAVTVLSGPVRSCGCLQHVLTHGLSRHPLYRAWKAMIARCEKRDGQNYHSYGGRGIKVCDRWHDVRAFVEDIERDLGPRPDGMTLDRINNDGDYEPGNVRWATGTEQNANRRTIRALTAERDALLARVAELSARTG